ncbi:MAG TPA: hypothetical protein VI011_14270 [Asanoa sp.]
MTYRAVDHLTLPSSFPRCPRAAPGRRAQTRATARVEGTVIDPVTDVAHLAQEKVALWRIPIVGGRFGGEPRIVEKSREHGIPAAFDEAIEARRRPNTNLKYLDAGFGHS